MTRVRLPTSGLCRRIVEYLTSYEGASKAAIERDVDGKTDRVRDAVRWMAAEERAWVRIERSGQTHRHFVTDAGREMLA